MFAYLFQNHWRVVFSVFQRWFETYTILDDRSRINFCSWICFKLFVWLPPLRLRIINLKKKKGQQHHQTFSFICDKNTFSEPKLTRQQFIFELINDHWLAEQALDRARDKAYFFTCFRSRFSSLKSDTFGLNYIAVWRDLEINFFGGCTQTLAKV